MTSKTLHTIPGTSKTDFLHMKTLKSIYWPFSVTETRDFSNFLKIIHKLTSFLTLCSVVWRQKRFKQTQELQKRIFYIWKHRNPYIGHFQVTKTRDFSNFLKIIHKLTSFLTSCSVIWRQKHFEQSQEPQKRIFYIGKHRNPYIGHFQVTKTRDFTNFLKIIHKLTSFLTLRSVVWRQKRFKQSQEHQQRIFYIFTYDVITPWWRHFEKNPIPLSCSSFNFL